MNIPYGAAIAVRLLSSALASLGTVIQRKAYVKNDNLPPKFRKRSIKQPLWHLGFWTYILFSLAGDYFSVSVLPILVTAPLGALSLFYNALFAHFMLKENLTAWGLVGTVLIAGGSVGIVFLLDAPEKEKTIADLILLLKGTTYIAYMSLTLFITLGLIVLSGYLRFKRPAFMRARGINYTIISTLLAAHALIFAKITWGLFELSVMEKQNQFGSVISWIIIGVTVLLVVGELHYYNRSIHMYTVVVVVPIGISLSMLLACFNTLVYYQVFTQLPLVDIFLVILCILVIFVGIVLLTLRGSRVQTTA